MGVQFRARGADRHSSRLAQAALTLARAPDNPHRFRVTRPPAKVLTALLDKLRSASVRRFPSGLAVCATMTDASDAASVGSAGERGRGVCSRYERRRAAHIGTELGSPHARADTNLVGGHNSVRVIPFGFRAR